MTLAELKSAVYSRLAADAAAPDYTAIHEDNITRWANEKTTEVIKALPPVNFQALVVIAHALTFAAGKASLPSDFVMPISVSIGSNDKRAFIYTDPEDYARWDSGNFVFTPTSSKPIALVANTYVYIKPSTGITAGKLDYVKKHPTLAALQDTVFNSIGDNLLIDLVTQEAKNYLQVMD